LLAVGDCATVYSEGGRVIEDRAPVTIHLTYGHVTVDGRTNVCEPLRRSAI